jgi:hypothetical protein
MANSFRPEGLFGQMRLSYGLLLVLLAAPMLAGCGKKPGHVDSPVEASESHYPQIYPDINTDPKP